MATNNEKRSLYLERKERGCCPRCGAKRKARQKTIYCEACKKYFSDYNAEHAEVINERRRNRDIERKSNRRCPRCDRYLSKNYSKVLCVSCLDKQYRYNYKRDRPEKNNETNIKKPKAVKTTKATKTTLDSKTKKRSAS